MVVTMRGAQLRGLRCEKCNHWIEMNERKERKRVKKAVEEAMVEMKRKRRH